MPITASDLRWYQSERMTDEDDGGGQQTAVEITYGAENQIFDDLSDVDRAAGDVSIRKVYAAVASADDAKYLDAGAVVLAPPADADVSVTITTTADWFDERAELATHLGSGIVRGEQQALYLWGDHAAIQRSLLLWAAEDYADADLPQIGGRLELDSGGSTVAVWVTGVTADTTTRTDGQGSYTVRRVIVEVASQLGVALTGGQPQRTSPAAWPTDCYAMRYSPDAAGLVGVRPLTVAPALGDYTVQVDSLYTPVIPTGLREAALADTTPGGDFATLVGAGGPISWSTTADAVGPGKSLYLGSPAMPGTVAVSSGGTVLIDDGGVMRLATLAVGTIDYFAGVCSWNDACPELAAATKSIAFTPAARPLRVADTAQQVVTVGNRGYVWVITLVPIPQPLTLRVSYRVNDQWYTLTDDGAGTLRGPDSSYGTGTIDYTTGTVVLNTGELPDPDSAILYVWGTPVSYTARGGSAVDAPVMRGQTAHPGLAPGTVSVTWDDGTSSGSLTDDGSGNLTGTGGFGRVRYSTGEWWVRPSVVPAMGTEFGVTYDHGPPRRRSSRRRRARLTARCGWSWLRRRGPAALR